MLFLVQKIWALIHAPAADRLVTAVRAHCVACIHCPAACISRRVACARVTRVWRMHAPPCSSTVPIVSCSLCGGG
jgi:hypothetical protein